MGENVARTLKVVVVATMVVVGFLVFFGFRGDRTTGIESGNHATQEDLLEESISELSLEEVIDVRIDPPGESGSTGRSTPSVPGAQTAATALGEASVSWTPQSLATLDHWSSWNDPTWQAVEASTLWAQSVSGEMQNPADPKPDQEWIVWITQSGYAARYYLAGPSISLGVDTPAPHPAKGPLVQVSGGIPNVPITVAQGFMEPTWRDRVGLNQTEFNALRLFQRTYSTNHQGEVPVSALKRKHQLQAIQGDLRSTVWTGEPGESVELILRPVFRAGGAALAPPGLQSDLVVTVWSMRGESRALSWRGPVHGSGDWGPAEIPILEGLHYIFHLEGSEIVPVEERLDDPEPNRPYSIDFDVQAALELPCRVLNRDDQGLAFSEVAVWWQIGEDWVGTRGIGDYNGHVTLYCPPGHIWVVAKASEHISHTWDFDFLEEFASPPLLLHLDKAGKISGRCLFEGSPVSTFKVNYFLEDDLSQMNSISIKDQADGSFVIDEAPIGSVTLIASSEELPPSRSVSTMVRAGETSELTVHLRPPLTGTGQVIDAVSGEPISAASFQLRKIFERSLLGPWGPQHNVLKDGTFAIEGFVAGTNVITVAAPGYASQEVDGIGNAETGVGFGVIRMNRTQDLTVRLVGEDLVAEECFVELTGSRHYPKKYFTSQGVMTYENLRPGPYELETTIGGLVLGTWVELVPGEEWIAEVHPPTGDEFLVDVVFESDPVAENYWLVVQANGSYRSEKHWKRLDVGSRASLPVPPQDRFVLELRADGESVAAKLVETESLERGPVELRIAGRSILVTVVDEEGAPLSGVAVIARGPGFPEQWYWGETTDADGLAEFVGIESRSILFNLRHDEYGFRMFDSIEARHGQDPIVLEFIARDRVDLTLLDGSSPLSGVPVELGTEISPIQVATARTDANGRAYFERLGEYAYHYLVRGPGLWTTQGVVESNRVKSPHVVQVRRLGSLTVLVKKTGLGVPDAQLSVTSVEFKVNALEWVKEGRVSASSGSLRTDEEGLLSLGGLPHGKYKWQATGPDGSFAQGVVEVPVGGTCELDIVLP